jgi:hypothetical protein
MHYGRELTNGISPIMTGGHAVAQLLDSLRYKPEGCGSIPYYVLVKAFEGVSEYYRRTYLER